MTYEDTLRRTVDASPQDLWRVLEGIGGERGWRDPDRLVAGGRTVCVSRTLCHPGGVAGHAYWWAVTPFHRAVFGGMLDGIVRAAERSGP